MKKTSKGFTLIELLIVITVIAILTTLFFVPYNYYSNLSRVRTSKEIFNQSIVYAKNSAKGITGSGGINQDIAIFLNKGEGELKIYSYPYNYTGAIEINSEAKFIKNVKFENNINLNLINGASGELENGILYFDAPNGEITKYISPTNTGIINSVIIGLKDSTSGVLSRLIEIK